MTTKQIITAKLKEERKRRDEEEIEFLEGILHLPFFEFCLQIKERKQDLMARVVMASK